MAISLIELALSVERTQISTTSVLISGIFSLVRTESNLADTRYINKITPDNITDRIFPIICAIVNKLVELSDVKDL